MATVSKFHPILLPPAGPIVQAARTDTAVAIRLRAALVANNAANIALERGNLQTAAGNVTAASLAAGTQWVANAFVAVQQIINGAGALAADRLYVVTTPEFGLNGRDTGAGVLAWDATGLMPEALRVHIQNQVQAQLLALPNSANRKVLFTFSCCSYPDNPVVTVEGIPKIGMNSYITAVALNNGVITTRLTRKRKPNAAADGMPDQFEFVTAWADGKSGAAQVRPAVGPQVNRDAEIIWDSPYSTPAAAVRIGFATCEDVLFDKRTQDINFVIISGSGTTFQKCAFDANTGICSEYLITQPFILNDFKSWGTLGPKDQNGKRDPVSESQLYSPGYYQRNTGAPDAWKPSLGALVRSMPWQQPPAFVVAPAGLIPAFLDAVFNNPVSMAYNLPAPGPPLPPRWFIGAQAVVLNPIFKSPAGATDIPPRKNPMCIIL